MNLALFLIGILVGAAFGANAGLLILSLRASGRKKIEPTTTFDQAPRLYTGIAPTRDGGIVVTYRKTTG